MKTTEFNGHVISWYETKGMLLGRDREERIEHWICFGDDENGTNYEGTAEYCCGELIEINDINIID